jgi:hypothetical protein
MRWNKNHITIWIISLINVLWCVIIIIIFFMHLLLFMRDEEKVTADGTKPFSISWGVGELNY